MLSDLPQTDCMPRCKTPHMTWLYTPCTSWLGSLWSAPPHQGTLRVSFSAPFRSAHGRRDM
eukprot:2573183-Alexandrium_andersonii.AAC.1